MNKKVLFLYSELSEYTINCINYFDQSNKNVAVNIVHWEINDEAPFEFIFNKSINHFIKKNINLTALINELKPDLVLCSGWFDKDYLEIIKKFENSIFSVLLFDNYWKGDIKQKIGSYFFKNIYKKYFDCCWVPGEIHKNYALKLGFEDDCIFLGFYATSLNFFNQYYQSLSVNLNIPKRFLYVGRYLEIKGIKDLWRAFELFSSQFPDWELHCVGTGILFENKFEHPKISHHGFKQQKELDEFVKEKGIFIMPSHSDHWGMAVQEFSAAGFPLILSDMVGSGSAFLKNDVNGYTFKAKNSDDLLDKMIKIAKLSESKLNKFSKESHEMSKIYDLNSWSLTLNKIIDKFYSYD